MVHQQDDDNPNPKICPLATAPRRLSALPMSAPLLPIRPIFTLLLLAFLAATFTCRFSLSLSSTNPPNSSPPAAAADIPPPIFNSTILALAQSDPGEPRLRQEIDNLLEGNFDKLSRFRPFILWRRFTSSLNFRERRNTRSPSFYRLYLRFQSLLSDWSRRRNNNDNNNNSSSASVLSDLLPLLSRTKKYPSCAVVGNSGILLNSDHGPAIDSHSAVIRLNNARIDSFSRHVGSKTTISFVNSNILHLCGRRRGCPCHPYGPSVPLLLYICQPIHFLDFAACNSSSPAPILVTNPRFDLLCAKIVKYYSLMRWFGEGGRDRNRTMEGWSSAHDGMLFHYSSGMQAVVMAAAVCDSVSLFGFGKVATAKHHYHTNQKAELQLHDYEAEYQFYSDLMERPHMIPFLGEIRNFRFPPLHIYH